MYVRPSNGWGVAGKAACSHRLVRFAQTQAVPFRAHSDPYRGEVTQGSHPVKRSACFAESGDGAKMPRMKQHIPFGHILRSQGGVDEYVLVVKKLL